jgi:hypothetical protein
MKPILRPGRRTCLANHPLIFVANRLPITTITASGAKDAPRGAASVAARCPKPVSGVPSPAMEDLPLISTLAAGFTVAWLLGLLTQWLRLSPIVGYLLAGVLIGP